MTTLLDMTDCSSVLEAIECSRIFSIQKMKDGTFLIKEECDNYFERILTKDQLLTLSDEIRRLAISNQLINNK